MLKHRDGRSRREGVAIRVPSGQAALRHRALSGVLAKYASLVGSAHTGAVTRPRA